MSKSNLGETGVESIRVGGHRVDELPIAEAAVVKQQMPHIFVGDRMNVLKQVEASYPKQKVAWVDGASGECKKNIKRIQMLIEDQNKMINDYSGHISLCKHRDREMAKLTGGEGDDDARRSLKLHFPPYDVKAMKVQIGLCRQNINRSNEVIDKEHDSIAKLQELRVKCVERDKKLKLLGVAV